ncbi:hypothetical protein ACFXGA_06335 [Actinosynnema sp. NPDC059335]|uniref:hypothetical protein n=1 Tax=Actinosynnema sp. NPDC059335 TaxID=3346804 RepID=UPI003672BA13
MTAALVDLIAAELDERGDAATSLHAEQQVDGYRAWLDTGRDLVGLAIQLEIDVPPLRLVALPSATSFIARANAVRHNRDLITAWLERETDPPIERIVRGAGGPYPEYALIEPNACRYCDLPKNGHYTSGSSLVGLHTWVEPTDQMRLTRMRARRAAKTVA